MYIKRFYSFINESEDKRKLWREKQLDKNKIDVSSIIPDKKKFTDLMLKYFFTDNFNKLQYELNSTKFIATHIKETWIDIDGQKTRWLKAHYKIKDIGYLSSDNLMNSMLSNATLPSRITTLNYLYTGNLGIKDHTNFPTLNKDELIKMGNKYRDFFELPVPSTKMINGQDIFSNIDIVVEKGKETYETEDFIVDIKYNNHFITKDYVKEIHKSEIITNPNSEIAMKEQLNKLIITAFDELYEALLIDKPSIIAEKEKEINRFTKSVYEEICELPNFFELLLFIQKYMPDLYKQFNIPEFHKIMYAKILTKPKHLDILYKIKKQDINLYNELIKYGNKYTDKHVGSSNLDDMLSFKK
jgi:hypothetical protein